MAIRPEVICTPYTTYSKEQTCDIIKFAQFEEGNLVSENYNNAEIGDESDDDSIMPPLCSDKEMDVMDYGDDSYHEPMSTEMLEDIR